MVLSKCFQINLVQICMFSVVCQDNQFHVINLYFIEPPNKIKYPKTQYWIGICFMMYKKLGDAAKI